MIDTEFITAHLNPAQKEAVETLDGPLLILAGAGSGKTRVLTHRVAQLIAMGYCSPDEILCVTFTNKAAREMEHRIFKIISDLGIVPHQQLWINTFHSICVRILRDNIHLLNYKRHFTIYDSSDQIAQIKKVMNGLNINDKMFPAKNFQHRISQAKMLGLTPADLEKKSRGIMDEKTLSVFRNYEAENRKANALDFDDLLLKVYELFRAYPEVLDMYQTKFRYIMVDEYQDTNHIQYLIVQMLARKHRNLCVVGDEDQSIYSWRGADIKNILDFEKDFPEAKVVKLEENYRSTSSIVNAATAVIKNNSQRKDKTLFTNNPEGSQIQVREEKSEYDEARYVAKTIQSLLNDGEASLSDIAIFYRTNAQSRVLEEQMRGHAIAYQIIGGIRFYERMEIKDTLSYMKLSLNPADDIALKRIINVPTRGIGKTTIDKLDELARESGITLYQAVEKAIHTKVFNAGTTSKLRKFIDLMEDLISSQSQFGIQEFYQIILDRTEYLMALKKENTPEAEARIQNLEELDNAIAQFVKERGEEASVQTFLEEMALASDIDNLNEQQSSVTMMTLHISKGLEFPYVFIVGCEENLFPSLRGVDENGEEDIEEERRLAYVGMTRARKQLWMTHTKIRRVWGQEQMNPPSRFIAEIPKQHVHMTSGVERSGFLGRFSSNSYGSSFEAGYSPAPSAERNSFYHKKSAKNPSFDFDSQQFPEDEDQSSFGDNSGYKKGMKVRHPTFGVGSIYTVEGLGDDQKISVLFMDNTIKKFVVKYARLERL